MSERMVSGEADSEPHCCPYCGSDGYVKSWDAAREQPSREWIVKCENRDRDCPVQPKTQGYATRTAAIAAWNRREGA